MKYYAIVFALAIVVYSCKKEEVVAEDCSGVTPTYNKDIKPIFDKSCATADCHDKTKPAEGIDLSSYSAAKSHTTTDNLVGSIQHLSGYKAMPQDESKLSASDIKLVACWVQNGAPE